MEKKKAFSARSTYNYPNIEMPNSDGDNKKCPLSVEISDEKIYRSNCLICFERKPDSVVMDCGHGGTINNFKFNY